MDLNDYTLSLMNYLKDHKFKAYEVPMDFVSGRAKAAFQVLQDNQNAGLDGFGANELAMKTLFVGVGSSRQEAAENILEDNEKHFIERINIKEPLLFDFWAEKFATELPLWESFEIPDGAGLDDELLEEKESVLIDRMDQLLTSYGL